MKSGTIRAGEARAVVRDAILAKGLSPAVWSFRDGAFHFLVNGREVVVSVPAGASFYGLRDIVARVERIIDEAKAAKVKANQLDIEDAIRAVRP